MLSDMKNKSKTNFTYIPPIDDYFTFESEEQLVSKLSQWGFNKNVREKVLYKNNYSQTTVSIVGYQEYGENNANTIIIEFNDGQLSCIHPAYLKEMQTSSFGKESILEQVIEPLAEDKTIKTKKSEQSALKKDTKTDQKPKKEPSKDKLTLPVDKVHFKAKITSFSTMYNHFKEEDDEVILFEDVEIIGENELKVGKAWCGYSNTLKKAELQEGESLEFDGKIVAKKFDKEIIYKINNPSKLTRMT